MPDTDSIQRLQRDIGTILEELAAKSPEDRKMAEGTQGLLHSLPQGNVRKEFAEKVFALFTVLQRLAEHCEEKGYAGLLSKVDAISLPYKAKENAN